MSRLKDVPETASTVTAPSRPRRRSTQSGLAVLARGESFVWLSGGMLIVAIVMIVTLLGFILARGASTFWPKPWSIYLLHDGSVVGGENYGAQRFEYDANQLGSLDTLSQQTAERRLGRGGTATAERQYLRVANFDLSGKHYDYVTDFQVAASAQPKLIWAIERYTGGRLYGWPSYLTEQFSAAFDAAYSRLVTVKDTLPVLGLDESTLSAATAEIDRSQVVAAQAYYANVLAKTPLESGERWQINRDGSWIDPVDVLSETTQTPPEAIRLIADDPQSIWGAYRYASRSISGLAEKIEATHEAVAEADEHLRSARLNLRQAEIEFGIPLGDVAANLESDWMAIAVAESQLEMQSQAVTEWLAAASISQEVVSAIRSAWQSYEGDMQSQIAEVRTRVTTTLDELALPGNARTAIEVLQLATTNTARGQILAQEQLARLEAELAAAEILVCSSTFTPPAAVEQAEAAAAADAVGPELSATLEPTTGTAAGPLADDLTDDAGESTLVRVATGADGAMQAVVVLKQQPPDRWSYARTTDQIVPVSQIVRAYRPNDMGTGDKWSLYFSRWWEFVSDTPRDGGMEGGFFPAIWGTVVMTMIMALFVVPFGVLAALYLREYAGSGWLVTTLRIAINNLAGVPSVVYGVFGLAFFCYVVGGYIDGGPDRAGIGVWPSAKWFFYLGIAVATSVAAFFLGFFGSGSPMSLTAWQRRSRTLAKLVWAVTAVLVVLLIAKTPFFDGFYQASLPNPTFGKGGLLWASLTLALLTLPVVIVATEEALSAVPNSLREGSYACGAGKWQTIKRIVLPHAKPGILTGMILAMARGAGEVAPMMLVGALPLAVELPLDAEPPFFHGSRSFMHLGFQIYALGFQGQNSEAAKPMVFTTTLVLILIVLLLNLSAIILRGRIRRQIAGGQF